MAKNLFKFCIIESTPIYSSVLLNQVLDSNFKIWFFDKPPFIIFIICIPEYVSSILILDNTHINDGLEIGLINRLVWY